MSKKSMSMCYPYGMGVSCICDGRGRIYKCFPNPMDMGAGGGDDDLDSEALLARGQLMDADGDGVIDEHDLLAMTADSEEARRRRGLDERTEIILAATFLVLVILAFISFVIYRCEKNYVRRRLHDTFHISPSTAALHTSNGLFAASAAANLPSISVSVQTDPVAVFANGHLAHGGQQHHQGATILSNGHGHLQGATVANSASLHQGMHHHQGSNNSGANHYHHFHGYSVATLPHNAHLAGGGGNTGGTALPSSPAGTDNASEEQTSSSNGVGAHSTTSGYGGSNIHSSHSYRDVRGGALAIAASSTAANNSGADNAIVSMANNNNNASSRDNTLSRTAGYQHNSREDGLSALRNGTVSPTLAHHHVHQQHRSSLSAGITMTPINILNGNANDVDDDDYAESDVMLGGGGGANNVGANNNGGSSSASGASGVNSRF